MRRMPVKDESDWTQLAPITRFLSVFCVTKALNFPQTRGSRGSISTQCSTVSEGPCAVVKGQVRTETIIVTDLAQGDHLGVASSTRGAPWVRLTVLLAIHRFFGSLNRGQVALDVKSVEANQRQRKVGDTNTPKHWRRCLVDTIRLFRLPRRTMRCARRCMSTAFLYATNIYLYITFAYLITLSLRMYIYSSLHLSQLKYIYIIAFILASTGGKIRIIGRKDISFRSRSYPFPHKRGEEIFLPKIVVRCLYLFVQVQSIFYFLPVPNSSSSNNLRPMVMDP